MSLLVINKLYKYYEVLFFYCLYGNIPISHIV